MKNALKEYEIPFQSLANGQHRFDYSIGDSFFNKFADSEVQSGSIEASVDMLKGERQLEFDITVSGKVEVICDRCSDEYMQPVKSQFTLYGKFGDGNSDEEYDVLWIPRDSNAVNLAPYMYELIILSLPLKRVHPEDEEGNSTCNPDMLNLLDDLSVNPDNEDD